MFVFNNSCKNILDSIAPVRCKKVKTPTVWFKVHGLLLSVKTLTHRLYSKKCTKKDWLICCLKFLWTQFKYCSWQDKDKLETISTPLWIRLNCLMKCSEQKKNADRKLHLYCFFKCCCYCFTLMLSVSFACGDQKSWTQMDYKLLNWLNGCW